MTENPWVSVIIPTWNRAHFVSAALSSVLAQTFTDLEAIVVDDGSDDGTAGWATTLADPRVRYVRQANQGAGAARNHGVRLARGRLIGFLDSDDLWSPDKLRLQTGFLKTHPDIDMVFGACVQFGETGHSEASGTPEFSSQPMPAYSSGTLLIRAEALTPAGEFATQWRVGEFMEWYARAQDAGLLETMLPDVVLRRRVHSGNLTAQMAETRHDYARILYAIHTRRQLRHGDAQLSS
jgi:glycosyltransferase involved in cell wall biosynthesis